VSRGEAVCACMLLEGDEAEILQDFLARFLASSRTSTVGTVPHSTTGTRPSAKCVFLLYPIKNIKLEYFFDHLLNCPHNLGSNVDMLSL
jgi:hypothetical protein